MDLSKYENVDVKNAYFQVIGKEAFVVGREVDENNHLWYVINENDNLTLEDAEIVSVCKYNIPLITQVNKINES